jgi:gentisate 1,2-dioxygenase
VLGNLVPQRPSTPCVPAHWRYAQARAYLLEAGTLITAREAERRVLVLENPGMRGASCITHSLFSGLQLIMPGEIAPSHRHTQSALRFVVEGEGAYTAVDGERVTMKPGDFILTPSWTYHDHGNPGSDPVVWLDGLDIPITNFFDTSFAERYPDKSQPVARLEGDALARYGSGMLPLEYKPPRPSAPIVAYPYARSRDALDLMAKSEPPDPRHGVKLQYANPATGGYPLPTIGAFLQLLPKGFAGRPYRSTDATVFCVAEGSGSSTIGERTYTWSKRDIFDVRVKGEAAAFLTDLRDKGCDWRETEDGYRVFLAPGQGPELLFVTARECRVQLRHLRPGAESLEDVFLRALGHEVQS